MLSLSVSVPDAMAVITDKQGMNMQIQLEIQIEIKVEIKIETFAGWQETVVLLLKLLIYRWDLFAPSAGESTA